MCPPPRRRRARTCYLAGLACLRRDRSAGAGFWLAQIRPFASSDYTDAAHPILLSLNRGAQWLSAAGAPAGRWVVLAARLFWAALLLFAADRSRRHDRAESAKADASVPPLMPIALSSYLEPYCPAPFAAVALLLVHAGIDRRLPGRLRAFA